MTILIDADGCPVVDLTLRSAGKKGVPVVILSDTSHRIEREGAQTLVLTKALTVWILRSSTGWSLGTWL